MTFLYALDLHEILILIAEHLDRCDILSCTKVSKSWYTFFLPFLWQKVVVTQAGPDFSHAHHLTHRILHLELQLSPVQSSVPTHGFSHLTTLKISGLDRQEQHHSNNWPLLTSILLSLGPTNSLQSLELRDSSASPAFWTALSQCPRLSSLTLARSTVPAPGFTAFWDTCAALESIHVDTVKISSGGMPLPKAPRSSRNGAFLRLKHLTHSYVRLCPKLSEQQDQEQGQGQTQDVESPAIFPWIFAPQLETLTLIDSLQRSVPTFSISRMVEDIQLAREAAAAGRNYYLDRNGEEQQDQQQQQQQQQQQSSSNYHYGLIPFCKLRALAIHSHRCSDGDIAFLINTIEALQRITLQFPGPALQTFCALGRHKHHLTEVDTRCWDVDSAQVLTLLTSCEKLEALAATEIRAQDVVECPTPWACLGLKRLTVGLVVYASFSPPTTSSAAEIARAAQAVFERLGQLKQLELLDISGGFTIHQHWQKHLKVDMGLGHLQGLKKLRHLCARGTMFAEMGVADAEWMVQHWPQLETVQMRKIDASGASPAVGRVFVQAGVLVKREDP